MGHKGSKPEKRQKKINKYVNKMQAHPGTKRAARAERKLNKLGVNMNQPHEPGVYPMEETEVLHPKGRQRRGAGRFFLGRRPEAQRFSNFTPEQQRAMNNLLGIGQANLGQIGQRYNQYFAQQPANFDFEPIAAAARRGFMQQTVPELAERFTAAGHGGLQSSGFRNALGSSASDLESNLAALRSKYALSQQSMAHNLLGQQQSGLGQLLGAGLQPRFSTNINPATQGLLQGLGGAAARGIGNMAAMAPFML